MSVKPFRERVELKVQDGAQIISRNDREKIIIDALVIYSKDCPIIQAESVAGDGGFDYTLPTGWVTGFSIVKGIEYPAGDKIPIYLEPEDWMIYDNATIKKLRFLIHSPGSTETFIVSYTIPYLESTIDNIPSTDIDAFCELAAAIYCNALANHYAQSTDSTIDIDSVDYLGKSTQWASNSKAHRKKYDDFLGQQDGVGAASLTGDWDTNLSNGADYLLHPRKSR